MFARIKLQKAIKFAIKTHEVYQKQKRKGKDVAYIVHPMTVALILSENGASEDLVIAGLLHDTIEDSVKEKKVSYDMIKQRFGKKVAELVLSVSEKVEEKSWHKRKAQALVEIKNFSQDSLFLKSADVVSNTSELVDDYYKYQDEAFVKFNASKEEVISHQLQVIQALLDNWPSNPLREDLKYLSFELKKMSSTE